MYCTIYTSQVVFEAICKLSVRFVCVCALRYDNKKKLYKVVGINDRTASQLTSWEGLNASKPIPVGCV